MPTSVAERFFSKVSPEPNSGCWLWVGAERVAGYGEIRHDGRKQLAHRVSWLIHFGDTGGLDVLHKCDRPCCVNPSHLFLGTHLDNMRDMARKGRRRSARGPAVCGSRLVDSQVLELRARHAAGERPKDLMARFGVSNVTVWNITRRNTWTHL